MVEIQRASSSPEEASLLYASLADFSRDGARARYADWLKRNGERDRARSLEETIAAYHSMKPIKPERLAGSAHWKRMVGIPLLAMFNYAVEELGAGPSRILRDSVFPRIKPALALRYRGATADPALGASYLWGSPDLADGEVWPRVSALSDWSQSKQELPQEQHCHFNGQIAFEDFEGTALAHEFPRKGGFQFFSFTDVMELGIVETLIQAWDPECELSRRAAPVDLMHDERGDGTNMPCPAYGIFLTEVLSIPDATWGPFEAEIPDCSYGSRFGELYPRILEACGDNHLGFGGYLSATSGADHSPGTDWLRLATLRTSPDCGVAHFAIQSGDLAEAKVGNARFVWSDWDS